MKARVSDIVIADFGMCVSLLKVILSASDTTFRAKHLHTLDEQLHSLAGSFGYVAPKVLKKEGHGKAVNMWSTG